MVKSLLSYKRIPNDLWYCIGKYWTFDELLRISSFIEKSLFASENSYLYKEIYQEEIGGKLPTTDYKSKITKIFNKIEENTIDQKLNYACERGYLAMCIKTHNQGADIYANNNYPLRAAAENNCFEVVKYLVEHDVNVRANDNIVLRLAARGGHFEIVKYLVEHGADVHAKVEHALRCAAVKGHIKIVKYLVEQEADIHVKNDDALYWAARYGYHEIVRCLIEQGADVSTLTPEKR